MGRMQDALRKAAEERERRRRAAGGGVSNQSPPPSADSVPEAPPRRHSSEAETIRGAPIPPPAAQPRPGADRPAPKPAKDPWGAEPTRAHEIPQGSALAHVQPERRYEVDMRVVCFHAPNDPRAEQFRNIRTALLGLEPLPRTIMITSGQPGEGKSLATANLAASLVEGGRRRVLVVDANFRKPSQHLILAARNREGLSDTLADPSLEPATLVVGTAIPGVDLMSAGTQLSNPGALLAPVAVAGVLSTLEAAYDFVFVDVPAMNEFADASVVAGDVDGVMLVLQMQGPPRRSAEKAIQALEASRARILGGIVTNCRE